MSGNRREKRKTVGYLFYWIIILVIGFDQFTKYLALHQLASKPTFPIVENVFHLTLVHNQGVAFGMFSKHPTFLLILITLSLIVLFVWSASLVKQSFRVTLSLGLIIGGALGNWIDRVRFGAVIDFFDFRIWPVFNIADTCISIGVFLYFLTLFKPAQSKKG